MKSSLANLSVFIVIQFIMAVNGQNCQLQTTCAASNLPMYTLVGRPGSTDKITLTCSSSLSSLPGVLKVSWLLEKDTNTGIKYPLHPASNPHLEQVGYNLIVSGATAEYEGIYHCQVQYSDNTGTTVDTDAPSGCLYIAGPAFFKSCPGVSCDPGNPTALQGEPGGDVEFDTRVEFRHGGSCGVGVNIRLMFLNKLNADGSVYICSNLGSFRDVMCSDRMRVSVSFRGAEKYDIKLLFQNLNVADSGEYEARVDTNDAFGTRMSITKTFILTVTEPTSPPTTSSVPVATTSPPTTSSVPVATTSAPVACTHDASPLLLLNGQEKVSGSTVSSSDITTGGGALMCVGSYLDAKTAQFLNPAGNPVEESDGFAVSQQGDHVISLSHDNSAQSPVPGLYCCAVSDTAVEKTCLNIV